MELEVQIRIESDLTSDDKQKIHDQTTIDEFYSEDQYRDEQGLYRYTPLTFDIREVGPYNRFDKEHTVLRINGSYFIAKVPYQQFKLIREKMMGLQVKTLKDFA